MVVGGASATRKCVTEPAWVLRTSKVHSAENVHFPRSEKLAPLDAFRRVCVVRNLFFAQCVLKIRHTHTCSAFFDLLLLPRNFLACSAKKGARYTLARSRKTNLHTRIRGSKREERDKSRSGGTQSSLARRKSRFRHTYTHSKLMKALPKNGYGNISHNFRCKANHRRHSKGNLWSVSY